MMRVRILILCALAVAANSLLADRYPIDRYRQIVERQMFGPLPAGFDPMKNPSEVKKSGSKDEEKLTKEQEQVKKAVRFSVINETPEGEVVVGFTDSQDPKTPHHYYLKVGETRDGWLVKEADIVARSMTIVKDGIEVTLTLGGDSSKAAGAVKPAVASNAQATGVLGGSIRGRRLLRERELKQQQDDLARQKEDLERQRLEVQATAAAEQEAAREERRKEIQQIKDELKKALETKKSQPENSDTAGEASGTTES